MTTATTERSSLGMDANLAATLSYVFGILSGLIVFLVEKQSRFVKFHAMQSILFSATLFVASLIAGMLPVIGGVASLLLGLGGLIVWALLMIKAFQGATFKLPVLGDLAERNAGPAAS